MNKTILSRQHIFSIRFFPSNRAQIQYGSSEDSGSSLSLRGSTCFFVAACLWGGRFQTEQEPTPGTCGCVGRQMIMSREAHRDTHILLAPYQCLVITVLLQAIGGGCPKTHDFRCTDFEKTPPWAAHNRNSQSFFHQQSQDIWKKVCQCVALLVGARW